MLYICPIISGVRNTTNKAVDWNSEYPTDKKSKCELFIPKSEIVSFGKYNQTVFDHFNKENQQSKE